MMKVSVIGQGYVGLPLALALVNSGYDVSGIDLDQKLVDKISNGSSPIIDITDQEVSSIANSGNYSITKNFDSVLSSEIVIICVPTPLNEEHKPDLSFLVSATNSISKNLQKGTLVINESTVSPGTTRGIIKQTLDKAGVDYDLAYSPERIDPANKKWKVTNTPKLVAGLTPAASERAAAFYETFVETVKIGSSPEVIETAKLLENSFRLINISFINEIAQFCAALKIDVREVVDAAATKPYGFMPFYPSAGVGGHCIPVDPSYLVAKAEELGAPTRFIDLANDVNRSLASYFTGIAAGILGGLQNKKILVVGIAYKPEVSDVRETPAAGLISELRSKGADVAWHDDLVKEWNGEKSALLSPNYDLVVLANPHSDTDLSVLASAKVLNTRGGY
jgi:UDP-N-acetyl-D-glucosamine dehydrogenase